MATDPTKKPAPKKQTAKRQGAEAAKNTAPQRRDEAKGRPVDPDVLAFTAKIAENGAWTVFEVSGAGKGLHEGYIRVTAPEDHKIDVRWDNDTYRHVWQGVALEGFLSDVDGSFRVDFKTDGAPDAEVVPGEVADGRFDPADDRVTGPPIKVEAT